MNKSNRRFCTLVPRSLLHATLAFALGSSGWVGSALAAEPAASDAKPPAPAAAPGADSTASVPDDEAIRLFEEAKNLYEAGQIGAACSKFQESAAKKPGAGVRFQLANCWQRLGRTASAYALFLRVADATRALGQVDRESLARDRAHALEPQLALLVLSKQEPEPGLELSSNGKPIPKKKWGVPLAVDPGEYQIGATAPGKQPWSAKVKIRAGEAGRIRLEIPSLNDAPPPPVSVAAPPPEPEPVPAEPLPEARVDPTRRTVMFALTGVGAVGLLAGVGFGAQYVANQQDSKVICPASRNCTPGEVALHDKLVESASSARTWAYLGVGAGAAALLGAGYLYLTDPTRQEKPKQARLQALPLLSADGGFGAVVSGGF